MDFSKLIPLDQVIDERLQDPGFRAQWDKTAFARQVAIRIIQYRVDEGLTQTQLAQAVGMKQPVIARLESGDQPPSLATLAKITAGTGLEFHLDVSHGIATLVAA
jgi:DNA-binding XRE family transcriptional regulator